MPCTEALACLIGYLKPQELTNIISTKSFLFLKRISEDSTKKEQLLEKKLAEKIVMNMLQVVFYKTLPCNPGGYCKNYPRKIVHKNDFLDVKLGCYFYHHEKDRRRFVINEADQEFCYTGNFGESKKEQVNQGSVFSLNFFESLFHPLYYKNFRCVRTQRETSVFCPSFHCEEEKIVWDGYLRAILGRREAFTRKRIGDEKESNKIVKKKAYYWKQIAFRKMND